MEKAYPIISEKHQSVPRAIAFQGVRYAIAFGLGFALVLLLVEGALSQQASLGAQFRADCNYSGSMASVAGGVHQEVSDLADAAAELM